jgi:hypothetical protein
MNTTLKGIMIAEKKAVFVMSFVRFCPPYWWERKQKLIAEGNAIQTVRS